MNLSISPDVVPILREGIFLGMVIVTVFGALLATLAKRMTRAVLGLIVCFLGIAGIYYFLNSPFVALMQILIYVGAVAITICFAIMLAEPDEMKMAAKTPGLAGPFAVLLGGAVTWVLASTAMHAQWMTPAVKINEGSVQQVGASLLTMYSMVFELVSIVLLLAILGSLVVARAGRDKAEC
ncbi:MAG: NADH-quinone oxidoreductase subunit J [Proteobacteria bacterium]|nr:NADH-quinone oxidoreductase subunit J [Pseudomonadota bacterium]MBU1639096.1 NADH-quinone oxidoreductase subunit J [Pseudomonadota bacterium]